MAEIKAATNEKVFQIKEFLGLNQNPDGDTKLKLGEAAVMENFRITRDRNLQRRPGTKTLVKLNTNAPIKGLWTGYVNGTEFVLGACDGKLYKFWDGITKQFAAVELGSISTNKDVFIFGFSNIAYILDGSKYWQWGRDETLTGHPYVLKEVVGYRPLVWMSITPKNTTDNSSAVENVNRLNGKRRVWLSPNGEGTEFLMPEDGIESIDYVYSFETAANIPELEDPDDETTRNWSFDAQTRTFAFESIQPQRANSFEIGYTVENTYRSQVENMQYAELYAGTQDTRIFLYGDGTNKTIYSGIDYNGEPRADFFPDLYEALIGDENTPITGMIRHYSNLACFKKDSAWSISASSTTLATGWSIPSFYVTPVNREIGLSAPGQVRLVMNSPFTLFGNDLYEWKNSSYYTSNLTRDERQARRISDRVWAALKAFDTEECYCYDDNDAQEYYICHGEEALVYNYAADAWSRYTALPVTCMTNMHGELYIGATGGTLKHLSAEYAEDIGSESHTEIIYPDGVKKVFTLWSFAGSVKSITITDLSNDTVIPQFRSSHQTGTWTNTFQTVYRYDEKTNSIVFTDAPEANEDGCRVSIELEKAISPIQAYWESGSMGFNQDFMRKYSAALWIAIRPESNGEIFVTVQTDRNSTLNEKVVDTSLSTLRKVNFAHWSFYTNRRPRMKRLKIKAKKFVFYKLIFKAYNAGTWATVVAADIRVRYTGTAK